MTNTACETHGMIDHVIECYKCDEDEYHTCASYTLLTAWEGVSVDADGRGHYRCANSYL